MKHELVDDTLYVEREKGGVIGRCTCGWNTGHRFSRLIASAAFREHQEDAARSEIGPEFKLWDIVNTSGDEIIFDCTVLAAFQTQRGLWRYAVENSKSELSIHAGAALKRAFPKPDTKPEP